MTDPIMYQLYIGMLGKLTLKNPRPGGVYTSILAIIGPLALVQIPARIIAIQIPGPLGLGADLHHSLLDQHLRLFHAGNPADSLLECLPIRHLASAPQTRCSLVCLDDFFWTIAGLTRGVAIPMAAVAGVAMAGARAKGKAVVSLLILGPILGPLTF